MASALASGMLADLTDAQARITKIANPNSAKDHRIRRLFVPRCRTVREDHRHCDRRGRSERSRKNAVIVDIELAPGNANGKVEYQHNFYILKPIDLSKGNHKMMYEPPNRGGKTYGR